MLLVVAATEPELRGVEPCDAFTPLVCGVGPIDAAAAVARSIAEARPSAILHVGIAGSRRAAAREPGHVVIGCGSIYCDAASTMITARAEADDGLVRTIQTLVPEATVETIGTSARVGGSSSCEVEAMEGFAVLRAANIAGVPAIEVRVISNEIEEEDRARWHFDIALARLAELVPTLIRGLT